MKDIIIIGGGAIGCSIARFLSKYKLNILLLEKNIEICEETTKANSAIIHGGYDAAPKSLKAKLNIRGAKMYKTLSEELGFTYKNIGSLVVGFTEQDLEVLEELYSRGLENGVEGLSIIDGYAAREMEPFISKEVKYALHCSSAGIVDPFNYTYSMMENAMENGVEIKTEAEVVSMEKRLEHILVKTKDEIFKTKLVINAAGLFSDKVANMAGDDDFYIIPTKGVYRLLGKNEDMILNKVLFQTPSEKGKGVLVTPTYAGNVMLGPTSIKLDGNVAPTEEDLETIDRLSKKTMPELDVKTTIRVFEGVRAKPNTRDFMIYKSEKMEGVIHVGGIESPGLSSAPAIAEYVEDLVLSMKSLELNKSYKKEKSIRGYTAKSYEGMDLEEIEEAEREIICKCEGITRGEIIRSINNINGAISRDGVKRRTRAGMGFCQGRRCGPKVREIIATELDIDESEIKEGLSGKELIEKYFR